MHLLLTFWEQTDEMYMKLIYYLIYLLLLMEFVHLKKYFTEIVDKSRETFI